jgi:hypothetical protein
VACYHDMLCIREKVSGKLEFYSNYSVITPPLGPRCLDARRQAEKANGASKIYYGAYLCH